MFLDARAVAVPADVDAGEVGHLERAHSAFRTRHGRGRPAPGVAPSRSSFVASTWRGISIRLPMKPWQTPATTGTFLIRLPIAIAVSSTSARSCRHAPLQQLHHVGRREEVHSDDVAWPRDARRDLVDVELGGVGREDRARLGDLVEPAEHLLLHVHILVDRLDDEVAVRPER
jgi:hypothetical protein